jgi:hypothetical protein
MAIFLLPLSRGYGITYEKGHQKNSVLFSLTQRSTSIGSVSAVPLRFNKNMKVGMPLPLLQYRDKDYGRRWPFGQIPKRE